jgi:hypothetical protein
MPHTPTQELEAVLSQQQILLHAIDWHIQVIYMLIINMSIPINTLTQLLRGPCPKRYSIYSLYQHKGTNTDAAPEGRRYKY